MKLPTTLALLAATAFGCAHRPADLGPTLSELRREAALPDGRWLVEADAGAGLLRVEAGAARLEFPGPEGTLQLETWRAGELWGLTGELQGQAIELRALIVDGALGWLWQIGGTFRGALRPLSPAGPLEGEWEVVPLAGTPLPESLELRAGELRLTEAGSAAEPLPCLLVAAGAGERVLVPAPGSGLFAPFHLLRLDEGWVVWREGEPLGLGLLHRPGARPAWLDAAPAAGNPEGRRFALASHGMVGELQLGDGKARMSWEGVLGEKKLSLKVAGVAGPLLRFEDEQEPDTRARLLTAGARGWFWIEGEALVLPAFETVAPAARLLGRWNAAPARLGAGGLGTSAIELSAERVVMIPARGERFEYPALACGAPESPVFFLRGPGAGLTVATHPAGEVVAVEPPTGLSALTVLFRGRAPGWLPLTGLEAALGTFCREAKASPTSSGYRQRVASMLERLDARRASNDALADLLVRLEPVSPEARYPLLQREAAALGVEGWKCRAAASWLAASEP